jgi:Uma2 family endonuclease
MPLALDPMSRPEPDIAVVPGGPRDYRKAHPKTALLLVEVADTTLAYDREWKGSLYARGGIRELWIVNLLDRVLEVYREPVSSSTAKHGWAYRSVSKLGPGETAKPLAAPGASVAVADLLP